MENLKSCCGQTAEDRDFLISNKNPIMTTSKQLIRAFYQGKNEENAGAGNCASIALIKAAINTFSFNVFDLEDNGDTKIVTLKNGEQVSFDKSELILTSKNSSFILGNAKDELEIDLFPKLLDYAHICFVVMCKMIMKFGDYNKRLDEFIYPDNIELALETLNDGTNTPNVYELLGLENHVSPVIRYRNLRKIVNQQPSCVAWSGAHTVFASNGYYDRYGIAFKFSGRVMKKMPGKFIAGVFYLKES